MKPLNFMYILSFGSHCKSDYFSISLYHTIYNQLYASPELTLFNMSNTQNATELNAERKQKLYTLLTKLHRAYGKQKNKSYDKVGKKLEYEGGYNAVKMTLLIFENVASVEDMKTLVRKEAKDYSQRVTDEPKASTDEHYRNVGTADAFRKLLAAIMYIDVLDVDNHHVLRDEIINFDYANG